MKLIKLNKIEQYLAGLPVVKLLIDKSKKISLPGFEGVPLYDVVVFFIDEVRKEGLNERAAAIAYNFIMAIPPTCLFLFTLVPNLPFVEKLSLQDQLNTLITDIIPAPEYNSNLIQFVNSFFQESRIGLLSFGFILLLFFASNAMMGIMHSFDKNYAGFEKRTGIQQRWMAIKLISLIMGLLLLCLVLLIMQGAVIKWLGLSNNTLIKFLGTFRWLLILGLVYSTFAFIYKYAPAIKKKWRLFSPGALLGTFLSVMATFCFSVFVTRFSSYNALYGSIGTVIVLMVMVYINSLVLLIGYELNVSIHSLKALADERNLHESGEEPPSIKVIRDNN